jgi:two-component system, LuxR family, response regulator FixJ
MNPQEAHIFFVDDDESICVAVQRTLESHGLSVSTFSSAQACLIGLEGRACDLVITDFKMEGMDGLSLLREIRQRLPWIPMIMTTGFGDVPLVVAATKAGAVNFIEKPLDRGQLLNVIEEALRDHRRTRPILQTLTPAEVRVLRGILHGKTNKEISKGLHRSIRTVEAHRRGIMAKFGVGNIAELVQQATALGYAKEETQDSDT